MKNTDSASQKGYDAGKKVSGIKRHIAVDTQGLPHAVAVTTAEVTDRNGALTTLDRCADDLKQVDGALVDAGYSGEPFAQAVKDKLDATVQVAKRSQLHTFAVIPKRWVVERSFAWCQGRPGGAIDHLESKLAELPRRLERLKKSGQKKLSQSDPDACFLRTRSSFDLGYTGEIAVSDDHMIVAQRVTQNAVKCPDALNQPDIEITSAIAGSVAFTPQDGMHAELQLDYESLPGRIFCKIPKVDELVAGIEDLEQRLNEKGTSGNV